MTSDGMNADPRTTPRPAPRPIWDIDREIVLSRVIAAPRERVFQAWTDPTQIVQWFGPDGFKTESLECDIRVGGRWRFIYTGPDGTRYDNRMVFLRIEAPWLIEMQHGCDKDNDAARFHVIVTFDSQSDGKTVMTMRQLHPTKEQRDATIGFGAVEFGYQTVGKLARYLGVS
ncbi:MAG TPA: SRPBCC family protein [Terriglobales bacterium]|nr:SRPBCC family protein [Terriglobales bacterium]